MAATGPARRWWILAAITDAISSAPVRLPDGIAAAFWVCGAVLLLASLVAFLILRGTRYADELDVPAPAAA